VSRKCRRRRSSYAVCACRRRIPSRGRKCCRQTGPRPSSICARRCRTCRRRSSPAIALWRPDRRGDRCTGERRRRSRDGVRRRRRRRRRRLRRSRRSRRASCHGCCRPSVQLGVCPTSACCRTTADDGRRLA